MKELLTLLKNPCIELKKFCKWCKKHTAHKEMKK
ncbi:50S ribosomal protein L33 [Candidatus Parcubacteria bacterium]|nr:50S ribosomal protein L33 [Candidatus Parcubacteria bacterium]